MKLLYTRRTALLTATLLSIPSGAMAHGDEKHNQKAARLVKKEQKEWGIAGDPNAVTRTVQIVMTDNMRFMPGKIDIQQDEVVKFIIKNNGKMLHEMVIGTKQVLEEHAALMVKFPTMEHEEPYMAHVSQGKSVDMIWNFNRPGEFDFACLIAGHYQAGMVGKIKVAAKAKNNGQATHQGGKS